MKKVLILDFGGQYNLLVARRVRECGVYCELKSFRISMDEVRSFQPDALIFTGGPATVFEEGAPTVDAGLFSMGIPVLGICYGMQLMMHLLGGQCRKAITREYGKTELTVNTASPLFAGVPEKAVYWMSHGVEVETAAPGFTAIAHSDGCRHAAVECREKKLYGVQFHPEVVHTEYGTKILENFLYGICGFSREWTMESYVETALRECREKIGDKRVLLALSGGVDSAVAAALLQRAVGDRLTCIFVDHGLLRLNEGDEVERVMKGEFHVDVRRVNAQDLFLSKLAGVTEPERKRKIIGEEFIRVFEAEAKKIGKVDFLAQGTIYPDVVESGLGGESTVVKSHHNVGGLPDCVDFEEIIEPLRRRGTAAGAYLGSAGEPGVASALPGAGSGHPHYRGDHPGEAGYSAQGRRYLPGGDGPGGSGPHRQPVFCRPDQYALRGHYGRRADLRLCYRPAVGADSGLYDRHLVEASLRAAGQGQRTDRGRGAPHQPGAVRCDL